MTCQYLGSIFFLKLIRPFVIWESVNTFLKYCNTHSKCHPNGQITPDPNGKEIELQPLIYLRSKFVKNQWTN